MKNSMRDVAHRYEAQRIRKISGPVSRGPPLVTHKGTHTRKHTRTRTRSAPSTICNRVCVCVSRGWACQVLSSSSSSGSRRRAIRERALLPPPAWMLTDAHMCTARTTGVALAEPAASALARLREGIECCSSRKAYETDRPVSLLLSH